MYIPSKQTTNKKNNKKLFLSHMAPVRSSTNFSGTNNINSTKFLQKIKEKEEFPTHSMPVSNTETNHVIPI
jgi:hypothetical protein